MHFIAPGLRRPAGTALPGQRYVAAPAKSSADAPGRARGEGRAGQRLYIEEVHAWCPHPRGPRARVRMYMRGPHVPAVHTRVLDALFLYRPRAPPRRHGRDVATAGALVCPDQQPAEGDRACSPQPVNKHFSLGGPGLAAFLCSLPAPLLPRLGRQGSPGWGGGGEAAGRAQPGNCSSALPSTGTAPGPQGFPRAASQPGWDTP